LFRWVKCSPLTAFLALQQVAELRALDCLVTADIAFDVGSLGPRCDLVLLLLLLMS
jgi:hypothetical protein